MRVVITGPESSGKTAIAQHLAKRYALPCALEYARIYLEEKGPDYDYDLLKVIAAGHKVWQARKVPEDRENGILDTDLINYKIWCEVVFGKCHPEILAGMKKETDHVYLLCASDLPWEPDLLRENPDDRDLLFERHREEITQLGRPYRIIRGTGDMRFSAAEKAFEELTS